MSGYYLEMTWEDHEALKKLRDQLPERIVKQLDSVDEENREEEEEEESQE